MTSLASRLILILIIFLGLFPGCGPRRNALPRANRPLSPTPVQAFREAPPGPLKISEVSPPTLWTHVLQNGMRIWLLERHDFPTVAMTYVSRRARNRLPLKRHGLAGFTALGMIDRIRDSGPEATLIDFDVSADATRFHLNVPADKFPAALSALGDLVIRPAVDALRMEQIRKDLLYQVRSHNLSFRELAVSHSLQMLFGKEDPIGYAPAGTAAGLMSLSAKDMEKFYQHAFAPMDSALVVAGDVSPSELIPLLAADFELWQQNTPPPTLHSTEILEAERGQIRLLHRHRDDAQIVLSEIAPNAGSEARVSFEALTVILNSPESRLFKRLRDDAGLTYGIRANYTPSLNYGTLSIETTVEGEKVAHAIELIRQALGGTIRHIAPDELEMAKAQLTQRLNYTLSQNGTASTYLASRFALTGAEYTIDTEFQSINNLSQSKLEAVALYIDPVTAPIVVIGNAVEIGEPLVAYTGPAVTLYTMEKIRDDVRRALKRPH